jgi:hypothetical protein
MNINSLAFTLGASLLMGVGIGALARRRGHGFWAWLGFGGLIPIVALPWLFFTKSKRKPDEPAPPAMLSLAVGSLLAVAALMAAEALTAPATIPACDSYSGKSGLKNVIANSPAGKAAGLEVVTLTDIKEGSKSPTEARCTATARMNNTNIVSIDYRFFVEGGQVLIEAHWKPVADGAGD